MEVVVVGGGVGGLSTALAVARLPGVRSVQVLEAQEAVGGRMRTKYDAEQRPLYEEGAWRISSAHSRMLRLCADLKLAMMEVPSEGADSTKAWLDEACETSPTGAPLVPCPRGTLSTWDVAAEKLGIRGADLKAAKTGYAGMDVMAAGSDSYGVETDKAANAPAYYVPERGMSSICAGLKEELERRPRCHVHLKTRVVDVRRAEQGYMVLCEERVGGNAFSGKSFWADAVVAAVPPSHIAKWQGVAERLAPVLASLSPVPLLKVFSEAGPEFAAATGLSGPFHIKSNTLGQQLISNTYPNTPFVQLAYCAGRRAEALERLRLCGDVMGPLAREILQFVDGQQLRGALLSKEHAVHFWSEAVHVWNPSYGLDVALKSAQACLVPHVALPRFFLCGEAFSTIQGWGEGALETSALVAAEVARVVQGGLGVPRGLFPGPRDPGQTLVYDGRLLEVGQWAKVHPGSEGAIAAHLGQDVTELWQSIMHPRYALGIVFALQVGWA